IFLRSQKNLAMVANRWISLFTDYNKAKLSFFNFAASPSVFTLRSSASGGLKPFSEENGFKNSKKTFFAARFWVQNA
ncbi:MAG: hypothetical protein ACI4JZ_07185, partial [Oscillospiraceae bacterium]